MLTGIVANYRFQSGPVLARTPHTSSHALSCLLDLLIGSPITLADMAAYIDPLEPGRAPRGEAAEPSSPFTHGGVR